MSQAQETHIPFGYLFPGLSGGNFFGLTFGWHDGLQFSMISVIDALAACA